MSEKKIILANDQEQEDYRTEFTVGIQMKTEAESQTSIAANSVPIKRRELPLDNEECNMKASPPAQQVADDGEVERQTRFSKLLHPVVKIFTVSTEPNYSMPWQMKKQKRSTASGFVISGKRIITNAHAIANQTSVMIRKYGNAKKYIAKVLAVGHECDLALLTVNDETFWEGIQPVEFGGIPNLQEAVTVVGYPTGGDNISVSTGVVSRVDITTYAHSSSKLLAIQIDAAINSGNSGGPAFNRQRQLCGVAFETLSDAENIGYIIPVQIIEHFLADIEKHGRVTGFCDLGVACQSLENPHLRGYMGMRPEQTGILVNKTEPLSPAFKQLNRFDVILSIDGVDIADDGTVPFRNGERISFRYLFTNRFVGETCKMKILRSKEEKEIEVGLSIPKYLVPVQQYDVLPSYYSHAGFVFVPLTRPYLRHQWGKQWDKKAPIKLCDKTMNEQKEFEEQEVVILAQVLAAEVNIGYQNICNLQVFQVNDVPVKNLRHLCQLVEANTQPYIKFDFEFDRTIILETKASRESDEEILIQHSIPFKMSADLRRSCQSGN